MGAHGVRAVLVTCHETSWGYAGSINMDDLPEKFPGVLQFADKFV